MKTKRKTKKGMPIQTKKDVKTMLLIICVIINAGFYTKNYVQNVSYAQAPSERYTYLPQNPDKANLSQIEQRLITANKIRALAKARDFKWVDYLVNLSCCESKLEMQENNKGNYPECSLDRGWFGINSYWHSEVTDEQARDLVWSANWTMDMIEDGQQGQWMCDKKIKGFNNYAEVYCGI